MFTDPEKLRKGDPGRPEICPVFALHQFYTTGPSSNASTDLPLRRTRLRRRKKLLAESINKALEPIRAKRRQLESDIDFVNDMLEDGANRARVRAQETMAIVREKMNLR